MMTVNMLDAASSVLRIRSIARHLEIPLRDLSEPTLGIAKREEGEYLSRELRFIEFPLQGENYAGYQELMGNKKGRARNTSSFPLFFFTQLDILPRQPEAARLLT